MTQLGLVETQWCWRVASLKQLSVNEIIQLARQLVKLVGMTCDGEPDCACYPTTEGKGGHGIQVYQRLVESFLVISTWPDFGFLRITLASCRPFDTKEVSLFLEDAVGKVQLQGGATI
jgi:S-adenosylmethionine/arginine decarboxylase-like enzyme